MLPYNPPKISRLQLRKPPFVPAKKPKLKKPWFIYLGLGWYAFYFFFICATFSNSSITSNIGSFMLDGFGLVLFFQALRRHKAEKITEVERKLDEMFASKPPNMNAVYQGSTIPVLYRKMRK